MEAMFVQMYILQQEFQIFETLNYPLKNHIYISYIHIYNYLVILSHISFHIPPNPFYQPFIRRQPVHTVQCLHCQPLGGFMLFQHQFSSLYSTEEAVHGQMKCRIIIFHRFQEIFYFNINIQLFFYLTDQRFLWRLTWLDLSARKFPAVFKFSISTLCRKNFIFM